MRTGARHQWYCEKKTDLQFRHPEIEIESAAVQAGAEAHVDLSADAVPISSEELGEALRKGRYVILQESRFVGTFEGVRVVGVPDLVGFRGRHCELVLEFKFSNRRAPFIDRCVQSGLYGWLLGQNDYDIGKLVCVVCVVSQTTRTSSKQGKMERIADLGLLDEILMECAVCRGRMSKKPVTLRKPFSVESGKWTLHAFRYDEAAAERHLAWAIEYWLGNRDPIPTKRQAKCHKCPYNAADVCKEALADPDAGFRVRRRKGSVLVKVPWIR